MALMPDFAKPIVDARKLGMRPDAMVIVSDGDLGLHRRCPDNPVVRVRPEQRPSSLSWRFLAGLEVEIATESTGARALALVEAIDAVQPDYLRVWHVPSDTLVRVRIVGTRSICYEMPCD